MFIRVTQLVVMVVLSLLTRRIPNKNFATSSLRIFSYTFSMVFGSGLFFYYFFVFYSFNPDVDFSILCITMNTLIVLYIVCVFIPPLVPVIRAKLQADGDKPLRAMLSSSTN